MSIPVTLDKSTYDSRLYFVEKGEESNKRFFCVYDRYTGEIKATAKKGAFCQSLNKITPKLNQILQNYVPGTLNQANLVRFYENLERLNEKVDHWNTAVKASTGVSILNVFLRIVTFNQFKYKNSLKAVSLDLSKLKPLYTQAKAEQLQAAIKIQSIYRMHVERKKYLAEINSYKYRLKKGAKRFFTAAAPVAKGAAYYVASETLRQAPKMIAGAVAKELVPRAIDAAITYGPGIILSVMGAN